MRSRPWMFMLIALMLGAALLAACGAPAQSQTAPGQVSDILPTPPPMPTGAPVAPTPTPPPAPASAGLSSAGASLLQADFNGAAGLNGWSVLDSTDLIQSPSIWEVQNGRLAQISDGDGLPGLYATALLAGNGAWRDYAVTAAAFPTGNDELGVVARASKDGYYVFRLQATAANAPRAEILRYDAASMRFTAVASADGPGFENGRWYTLSLRVRGDRLEASVDGQPILTASDATFASGQAGVYGFANGGLTFDNFTVQALSAGNQ